MLLSQDPDVAIGNTTLKISATSFGVTMIKNGVYKIQNSAYIKFIQLMRYNSM